MNYTELEKEYMYELNRLKITDNQRNKIRKLLHNLLSYIKTRVVSKELYYNLQEHHNELKKQHFELKDKYKKLKYCHSKIGIVIEESNNFERFIKNE
jgi:hypothetical protein